MPPTACSRSPRPTAAGLGARRRAAGAEVDRRVLGVRWDRDQPDRAGEPLHPRPQDRPALARLRQHGPAASSPLSSGGVICQTCHRHSAPVHTLAWHRPGDARTWWPGSNVVIPILATCCRRAGNITAHADLRRQKAALGTRISRPSTRHRFPGTTSRCSMGSRCLRWNSRLTTGPIGRRGKTMKRFLKAPIVGEILFLLPVAMRLFVLGIRDAARRRRRVRPADVRQARAG